MKTTIFNYDLPEELIAQSPPAQRDASRMLKLNRVSGTFEHSTFTRLGEYLSPGDLLVFNDTRVLPARFEARKPTGGRVEGLFLRQLDAGRIEVLLKASKRPKEGSELLLGSTGLSAILEQDLEQGGAVLKIDPEQDILHWLETEGEMPLPPYIGRKQASPDVRTQDRARYQTVYADRPGAVAAPTAGLHFTRALLQELDTAGIGQARVTLHVGPGTFRPVSAEHLEDHVMHSEYYEVSDAAAETVLRTREAGGRIVAVGSTSLRTLESLAARPGGFSAGSGDTDLFIYPPYDFQVVDALLTNFHLPCSTLLMMVCAFAGTDETLRAYQEAVAQRYRFFSYGDCMLVI